MALTTVKLFVYVATDRFAAECLGRFSVLLPDLQQPDRERHLFVWAGGDAPPADDDYWRTRYPAWLTSWAMPSAADGLDLEVDRAAVAAAIADWLATPDGRHALDAVFSEWPREHLGAVIPVDVTVVLVGSLTSPAGSAAALGFVLGLGRLRQAGVQTITRAATHLVVALGPADEPDGQEEKRRALAARSLLDLQALLESAPSAFRAPVWVVGEHLGGEMPSNRAAQVSVTASLLLALSRSVVDGFPDALGASNPFLYRVDSDGQLTTGARLEVDHPFGVVGGYTVSCPAHQLARILAARMCGEFFGHLVRQALCSSIEECARLQVPGQIAKWLDGVEGQAIAHVWEALCRRHAIPWTSVPERLFWFDLGRVQMLFESVFKTKAWERVLDVYGEERLSAVPLQDWPGALDDLTEAVEQGVLTSRRRQVDEVSRRILVRFVSGVEEALGQVFAAGLAPPVGEEPHRVAQALVGRIWRSLEERRIDVDRAELVARPGGGSAVARRDDLKARRDDLEKAIDLVPSPIAVMLRLVPAFFAPLVLVLLLPFDLGVLNDELSRLLAGGLAGTASAGWLFYRHAASVRRRLFGLFKIWLRTYRAVLDDEDEVLRFRTYAGVLDSMRACVEWFFSGSTDAPPIPRGDSAWLKEKREEPVERPQDVLRPQAVLKEPLPDLAQARDSFSALERRLVGALQPSLAETILPEVRPGDTRLVDAEYAELVVAVSRATGPAADAANFADLVRRVREWAAAHGGTVPYGPCDPDPGAASVPRWRRSFVMPSGTDLIDQQRRAQSSALQFFDTAARFVHDKYQGRFDLVSRLEQYRTSVQAGTIEQTPLMERYRTLSQPAPTGGRGTQGGGAARITVIVGAGNDDPLALALHGPNDAGARRMSSCVQVDAPLRALDVIFVPNADRPATPLGLAWKAHETQPDTRPAFKPAKLIAGVDGGQPGGAR